MHYSPWTKDSGDVGGDGQQTSYTHLQVAKGRKRGREPEGHTQGQGSP